MGAPSAASARRTSSSRSPARAPSSTTGGCQADRDTSQSGTQHQCTLPTQGQRRQLQVAQQCPPSLQPAQRMAARHDGTAVYHPAYPNGHTARASHSSASLSPFRSDKDTDGQSASDASSSSSLLSALPLPAHRRLAEQGPGPPSPPPPQPPQPLALRLHETEMRAASPSSSQTAKPPLCHPCPAAPPEAKRQRGQAEHEDRSPSPSTPSPCSSPLAAVFPRRRGASATPSPPPHAASSTHSRPSPAAPAERDHPCRRLVVGTGAPVPTLSGGYAPRDEPSCARREHGDSRAVGEGYVSSSDGNRNSEGQDGQASGDVLCQSPPRRPITSAPAPSTPQPHDILPPAMQLTSHNVPSHPQTLSQHPSGANGAVTTSKEDRSRDASQASQLRTGPDQRTRDTHDWIPPDRSPPSMAADEPPRSLPPKHSEPARPQHSPRASPAPQAPSLPWPEPPPTIRGRHPAEPLPMGLLLRAAASSGQLDLVQASAPMPPTPASGCASTDDPYFWDPTRVTSARRVELGLGGPAPDEAPAWFERPRGNADAAPPRRTTRGNRPAPLATQRQVKAEKQVEAAEATARPGNEPSAERLHRPLPTAANGQACGAALACDQLPWQPDATSVLPNGQTAASPAQRPRDSASDISAQRPSNHGELTPSSPPQLPRQTPITNCANEPSSVRDGAGDTPGPPAPAAATPGVPPASARSARSVCLSPAAAAAVDQRRQRQLQALRLLQERQLMLHSCARQRRSRGSLSPPEKEHASAGSQSAPNSPDDANGAPASASLEQELPEKVSASMPPGQQQPPRNPTPQPSPGRGNEGGFSNDLSAPSQPLQCPERDMRVGATVTHNGASVASVPSGADAVSSSDFPGYGNTVPENAPPLATSSATVTVPQYQTKAPAAQLPAVEASAGAGTPSPAEFVPPRPASQSGKHGVAPQPSSSLTPLPAPSGASSSPGARLALFARRQHSPSPVSSSTSSGLPHPEASSQESPHLSQPDTAISAASSVAMAPRTSKPSAIPSPPLDESASTPVTTPSPSPSPSRCFTRTSASPPLAPSTAPTKPLAEPCGSNSGALFQPPRAVLPTTHRSPTRRPISAHVAQPAQPSRLPQVSARAQLASRTTVPRAPLARRAPAATRRPTTASAPVPAPAPARAVSPPPTRRRLPAASAQLPGDTRGSSMGGWTGRRCGSPLLPAAAAGGYLRASLRRSVDVSTGITTLAACAEKSQAPPGTVVACSARKQPDSGARASAKAAGPAAKKASSKRTAVTSAEDSVPYSPVRISMPPSPAIRPTPPRSPALAPPPSSPSPPRRPALPSPSLPHARSPSPSTASPVRSPSWLSARASPSSEATSSSAGEGYAHRALRLREYRRQQDETGLARRVSQPGRRTTLPADSSPSHAFTRSAGMPFMDSMAWSLQATDDPLGRVHLPGAWSGPPQREWYALGTPPADSHTITVPTGAAGSAPPPKGSASTDRTAAPSNASLGVGSKAAKGAARQSSTSPNTSASETSRSRRKRHHSKHTHQRPRGLGYHRRGLDKAPAPALAEDAQRAAPEAGGMPGGTPSPRSDFTSRAVADLSSSSSSGRSRRRALFPSRGRLPSREPQSNPMGSDLPAQAHTPDADVAPSALLQSSQAMDPSSASLPPVSVGASTSPEPQQLNAAAQLSPQLEESVPAVCGFAAPLNEHVPTAYPRILAQDSARSIPTLRGDSNGSPSALVTALDLNQTAATSHVASPISPPAALAPMLATPPSLAGAVSPLSSCTSTPAPPPLSRQDASPASPTSPARPLPPLPPTPPAPSPRLGPDDWPRAAASFAPAVPPQHPVPSPRSVASSVHGYGPLLHDFAPADADGDFFEHPKAMAPPPARSARTRPRTG